MEIVSGYVEHIVFRNEENGYTVFHLDFDQGDLTCVGTFHTISEGEGMELEGEYMTHPMYGTQLQVYSYKIKEPEDLRSIERYLGSGAIRGVGEKLAKSIVKTFKMETFRIIDEEPERLAEIKGISERKAREISLQIEEKKDMRKSMIFLQNYGISLNLSVKIYDKYGPAVYRIMENNPYQLADQVDGVGFKTADEIARQMGFFPDSEFRIKSGIFYTLQRSVLDGHVYLRKEELFRKAAQILEVEDFDMEIHLMDLSMEKKIKLCQKEEEIRVYSSHYYYLELNTARMLFDLNIRKKVNQELLQKKLEHIQETQGIALDEKQVEGILHALSNGVSVLTGGPGTGKTTTINTMIRLLEKENLSFALAAPTGRAAKRMTEATGYEAKTIHRLLEVSGNPEEEGNLGGFLHNEENPLEADAVIVDEMSMVDLSLMNALLRAIPVGTILVLVGDEHQLPSVGCGSVLKDMIGSGCIPVTVLDKIFRQAGESDIVVNAHKIHHGKQVLLDNQSKDFFFLKRMDATVIQRVVLALIKDKLPGYVGAGMLDIQVLTPMRKGPLGVESLNGILQKYLNPKEEGKPEKELSGRLFRLGDKVMQIKNNYQLEWEIKSHYGMTVDSGTGIFNGDLGIITEMDSFQETITITFDENKQVVYEYGQMDEIELAYAITIHKSQGSEYPAVVIPLLSGPKMLMTRNLLYTAITRAKKCVTLVGSEETFYQMAGNTKEQVRYSGLSERLRELWEEYGEES